ncbi:uncharacterized protein LOC111195766 [Astyanax mexicanus]|uniref:uncharacterized protein LOC111195766 n=1 Tax=Astyanax mexicanus TaxID=7994 RepID=UPI0020CAEB52|nr:uncharacterized protein LOC111195766 [Astyanax mexicanus]
MMQRGAAPHSSTSSIMADGSGSACGEVIFKWTRSAIEAFIKARIEKERLFTGEKNSALSAWKTILLELGLADKVTPQQARKKWDNLKKKYKAEQHLPLPCRCCAE